VDPPPPLDPPWPRAGEAVGHGEVVGRTWEGYRARGGGRR